MAKVKKSPRVVDLFSGGGGFSTGAVMAGGRVILAINHDPDAVAMHAQNHPKTQHLCQDMNVVNWRKVPDHDVMAASPCCQGHSRALGGREHKHSSESRQTAWSVMDAVTIKRPEVLVVENVPEFLKWEDYDLWRIALERKGYHVTENVLNAKNFGVPQNRERLFIIASLEKSITLVSPNLPEVSARGCIDWDHPKFRRIDAKVRADIVMRQLKAGRKIHGDRFLIVYNGTEQKGRSLDKPMPTITCSDRIAVVKKDLIRFLQPSEMRLAMGFPKDYILPRLHEVGVSVMGNAVPPPMAAEVLRQVF